MNPILWIKDIKTFFAMARAIWRRQYKMPWNTLIWAILCLVYLLSPIDFLPDALLPLGIADDGAFLLYVLSLLHKDLDTFRQSSIHKDDAIEAEVINTFEKKK